MLFKEFQRIWNKERKNLIFQDLLFESVNVFRRGNFRFFSSQIISCKTKLKVCKLYFCSLWLPVRVPEKRKKKETEFWCSVEPDGKWDACLGHSPAEHHATSWLVENDNKSVKCARNFKENKISFCINISDHYTFPPPKKRKENEV